MEVKTVSFIFRLFGSGNWVGKHPGVGEHFGVGAGECVRVECPRVGECLWVGEFPGVKDSLGVGDLLRVGNLGMGECFRVGEVGELGVGVPKQVYDCIRLVVILINAYFNTRHNLISQNTFTVWLLLSFLGSNYWRGE